MLTALRVRHVSPSSFTCCEMHEAANARFFKLTNATIASNWRQIQSLTRYHYAGAERVACAQQACARQACFFRAAAAAADATRLLPA